MWQTVDTAQKARAHRKSAALVGLAIATTRGRAAGRAGRRAAAAEGCRATKALLLSAMLLATKAAMLLRSC